jgi:hypothetical protein
MKKFAFLAVFAAIGVLLIAAKCTLKGVTVTEIDGDIWYSAEMEYSDGPNIINHTFKVGFINDGALATTKTATVCLRSLQSGNSNFFSANSGLSDSQVDTALSNIAGPLTFGDTVNGDLTFSAIDITRDGEDLVINGTIKNTDNDDLTDVRVCAVIRNDDGDITVVMVDGNDYDLDSDESANFSISGKVPDDNNDVDKVDLWADGKNKDEGSDVTDPESKLNNPVAECTTPPTNTPVGSATPTSTNTFTPTNTPGAGTPTVTNTAVPSATPVDAC